MLDASKFALVEARTYLRWILGLPVFLRQRLTVAQAEQIVRHRLANREAAFLRLAERGIYGHPRSPYLPLLRHAGCELGDLRALVNTNGLENALRELHAAGVYVRFDEFKGRAPIVRPGLEQPVHPADFDNPHVSRAYESRSGGTTGAGTRVSFDLDHLAATAANRLLAYAAAGVATAPTAIWRGGLPDGSSIANILHGVRIGNVPRKWFSPEVGPGARPAFKYRLATSTLVALGRASGVPIPSPEPAGLDHPEIVARWIAETQARHGACLLRAHLSAALRVCLAARAEGLDIAGATFISGGEPATPAKIRGIVESGVRWLPSYSFTELGMVGIACTRPSEDNDLHVCTDSMAIVQYDTQVPRSGVTVPAFGFTSLLPTAPKIMLNVESDDYGVLETRRCGCPLDALGLTQHVRQIRSYGKLTAEGVTLVGSEMLQIMDEVLPARFGGGPLDYQLQEEEDERGFTRLSLLVSPRLGPVDEAMVVRVVLDALRHSSGAADIAQAIWNQAEALRVKRQEPAWSARGKLVPLQAARRPTAAPVSTSGPEDTAPPESKG